MSLYYMIEKTDMTSGFSQSFMNFLEKHYELNFFLNPVNINLLGSDLNIQKFNALEVEIQDELVVLSDKVFEELNIILKGKDDFVEWTKKYWDYFNNSYHDENFPEVSMLNIVEVEAKKAGWNNFMLLKDKSAVISIYYGEVESSEILIAYTLLQKVEDALNPVQ